MNIKIDIHAEDAIDQFTDALIDAIYETNKLDKDISILCFGTDKITGDALGPLVGQYLKARKLDCSVIGDLANPLTYNRLKQVVDTCLHKDCLLIAVDAATVSNPDELYKITIKNGPIVPGAGIEKPYHFIGDISITASLCLAGNSPIDTMVMLSNTRLWHVMTAASIISQGLTAVLEVLPTFKDLLIELNNLGGVKHVV